MKKNLLAGLVGGLIMFAWGFIYWGLTGAGASTVKNTLNDDAMAAALRTNLTDRGVYVVPSRPATMDQAAMDLYTKKYEQGPIALIIYDPMGSHLMTPGQMIGGFLLGVLACCVAAWFLSRSTATTSTYFARVAFCGMFGILISLSTHLVNWNWMGYPLDYVTKWIADSVIGWLLAGLGIAAIVKPPKVQQP